MLPKRKFGDFAIEDDVGAAIGKDHSCSSGSVLTDHEDGIADYTCGHGGLPSPTVLTRPVSELLGSGTATTATSPSLPKKSGSGGSSSRRAAKRREVTVPIAEIKGMKGGSGDCTPPPDAWTWRKYGQKPIKGSPYPRGYYRCSSSKGCPARKQVERNRLDPTMLVITYASEHNHPLPEPRAHGQPHRATHNQTNSRRPGSPPPIPDNQIEEEKEEEVPIVTSASLTNTDGSSPDDSTFTDLGDASSFMPLASDFGWFSGLIETPLPTTRSLLDDDEDVAMMLPMTCSDVAEDDALFGGLGELPECAVVFRSQTMAPHGKADEGPRCSLTAWCESSRSVR